MSGTFATRALAALAASEVQIAASDHPDAGLVVFEDVSDKARDDRAVQLAGIGHIEVLCDYTHQQCEAAATQALLTERLFLEVLKASRDYRPAYRNDVQTDPTQLPVPSP